VWIDETAGTTIYLSESTGGFRAALGRAGERLP
jgi:hypothetical protein